MHMDYFIINNSELKCAFRLIQLNDKYPILCMLEDSYIK